MFYSDQLVIDVETAIVTKYIFIICYENIIILYAYDHGLKGGWILDLKCGFKERVDGWVQLMAMRWVCDHQQTTRKKAHHDSLHSQYASLFVYVFSLHL